MISPAEMAAMQATSQASGDLTINVFRPTLTQSGGPAVVKTFPGTPTHVYSGNLAQPTAGQLANYGYAVADVDAWLVRVPVGSDVKEGDRLQINGYTLEVQIELQPQSYQTSLRFICAELERA